MVSCKGLDKKSFGLEYGKPVDFISMQVGGSKSYLAWTTFWALYFPIWLGLDWYWYSFKPEGPKRYWIVFLTNLAYFVLCVMVITEWVIAVYTRCRDNAVNENSTYMPWYLKMNWVLNSLTYSTCLVITMAYWVFLWRVYRLRSINKHGINVVYILLQIFLSSKPIRWQHFYMPVILNLVYFIFSASFYSATGLVLYSFLDWGQPGRSVPLSALYTFILLPAFHVLLYGLYRLKLRVFRKSNSNTNSDVETCSPEEKPLKMEEKQEQGGDFSNP